MSSFDQFKQYTTFLLLSTKTRKQIVFLWALRLKGINWQPHATHLLFIGVMLYRMLYIAFQFLLLSKRSHCFSTSCSFSPTRPPFFCISSRQGRWQRGLFILIFHDSYFVSSDVEINFSLGQKQTVLLMCDLRGQLSNTCSE